MLANQVFISSIRYLCLRTILDIGQVNSSQDLRISKLQKKKRIQNLPCSTNRELDSTDQKLQEQNSAEFLN